jgi:hypothetical protein
MSDVGWLINTLEFDASIPFFDGIHPWYIVEGRMESDLHNRKQVTAK